MLWAVMPQVRAVTLHLRTRFEGSLAQRRDVVQNSLVQKAESVLHPLGGTIQPDTFTVSGQSVEARVPVEHIAHLTAALEAHDIVVEDATPRDVTRTSA